MMSAAFTLISFLLDAAECYLLVSKLCHHFTANHTTESIKMAKHFKIPEESHGLSKITF